MAVTHTGGVGIPLEQSYMILRDAERVKLDIGALGLDKRTPHRGEAHFRFQLLPQPDGLDDLANTIWMSMSDANCSKMVSVDLSVWINDSTNLVMIGPAGDLDMPAAATAKGVISISVTSYVTFGLSIELLGVSGKRQDVHTYSSALIALNDALEDWANNLISALEH